MPVVAAVGTMKETLPGTPAGVALAAEVSPWKLPRSSRASSVTEAEV